MRISKVWATVDIPANKYDRSNKGIARITKEKRRQEALARQGQLLDLFVPENEPYMEGQFDRGAPAPTEEF